MGKSVFQAYRYTKPRRVERTPILRHEGEKVIKFGEKCELLRTVMFPPPPDSVSQSQMSDSHALPWPDITSLEIKEAIFSSNPNKAPGPDGMTFLNLQQAYMAVPWLFDLIYRSLLIVGYHPHCWREGIGAILKKGNKPDYTTPKAYRVIVLLNCLGKVSEKIIAKRLSYLSEANQLLHMQQMGGRRQRTAIDAAMALTHDIQCAKNVKRITSVLFLDVKGAFDHVSKERLIQVLRQMTLPPPLLSWVRNFLSERRLGLAFDGEREAMTPIDTGIPQGSPTSPILFILYLRYHFDTLNERHPRVKVPSYIDDIALTVEGNTEGENSRELEKAAKTAFDWATNNAVAFDETKTELIHFSTKRTPNTDLKHPSRVLTERS